MTQSILSDLIQAENQMAEQAEAEGKVVRLNLTTGEVPVVLETLTRAHQKLEAEHELAKRERQAYGLTGVPTVPDGLAELEWVINRLATRWHHRNMRAVQTAWADPKSITREDLRAESNLEKKG